MKDNYDNEIKIISKYLFLPVNDEEELDNEPYATNEQKKRDMQITKMMAAYIDDYQIKTVANHTYRGVIFWSCTVSVFLIVLMCLYLLFRWIPIITSQYEGNGNTTVVAADTSNDTETTGTTAEQLEAAVAAAAGSGTTAVETDSEYVKSVVENMFDDIVAEIDLETITKEYVIKQLTGGDTEAKSDISVRNVVSLVTICLTMLGAILGLLKIVAEYVFQKDEDQNVREIVKSLQENDYNHKKAVLDAKYGKRNENSG